MEKSLSVVPGKSPGEGRALRVERSVGGHGPGPVLRGAHGLQPIQDRDASSTLVTLMVTSMVSSRVVSRSPTTFTPSSHGHRDLVAVLGLVVESGASPHRDLTG